MVIVPRDATVRRGDSDPGRDLSLAVSKSDPLSASVTVRVATGKLTVAAVRTMATHEAARPAAAGPGAAAQVGTVTGRSAWPSES